MKIVFDMDNTLVDEFGSGLRPGIVSLLQKLEGEGHTLILWTSSTRERALTILNDHKLKPLFQRCLFREDYDPNHEGRPKDIRTIKGDFLIDDDPMQIDFVKSVKKDGFLISSYRKDGKAPKEELVALYQAIHQSQGLFKKLTKKFGF